MCVTEQYSPMGVSPSPGVSNETVVRTYDWLAAPYDLLIAPIEAGTRSRAIELLALSAGDRVLELGSGPGHALPGLAGSVGPGGQVIGLDAAPRMVARARRRVADAGDALIVEVLLGDARSLPLPATSVDAVFVEDTLELFSTRERRTVLAECNRVLVPGGRLGVVTMERSGLEDDRFVRIYEWLYEQFPGYDRIGCRPIYARDALEAAGFSILEQERRRRGYVWPVEILIAERV